MKRSRDRKRRNSRDHADHLKNGGGRKHKGQKDRVSSVCGVATPSPRLRPRRPPQPKRNRDLSSFELTFQDHLAVLSSDSPNLLVPVQLQTSSFYDIRICTLNMNSMTDDKFISILALIKHLQIDVFVCTDTRHRESSSGFYTRQAKLLLGSHTRVLHSPCTPKKVGSRYVPNVGGQMILVSSTWSGAISDHYVDPSQLGLLSSVTISTGHGKLLLFGTYWPYPPDTSSPDTHGLWNRTKEYLQHCRAGKSPREYIQHVLCKHSEKHIAGSPYNLAIVCGDFNHGWDQGLHQLQPWALSNHWSSPVHSLPSVDLSRFFTFSRGSSSSWIDHFLVSPPSESSSITSTVALTGPFLSPVSDHRPLIITATLPGGRGSSGLFSSRKLKPPPPTPLFNSSNDPLVAAAFSSYLDDRVTPCLDPPTSSQMASDNLLNAVLHSVAAAHRFSPKPGKPQSAYKNGWSPVLMALKLQSMAILQILGHLQGTRGRRIWYDKTEQDIGIRKIVSRWVKSVRKLSWLSPSDATEHLNITPHGPSYWSTLPGLASVDSCIKILSDIKSLLHGRQRQVMRANINAAVKHRENLVLLGKHGAYIRNVLREQVSYSTLNSLRHPDGRPISDPYEIHRALTDHFDSAYSIPPSHSGGIHAPDWDWRTGGSREDFNSRISHLGIPMHLCDVIWNAMSSSITAPSVYTDLTASFQAPPTFDEFCLSISSRSSRTAGGLTGLTYKMMKAWSPSFKRHIYDNLLFIWKDSFIPDWWRWRWLCPIPKSPDDDSIGAQRPIMLVEVLRKAWISIIVYRINSSWNRHNSLHPSQHGFRSRHGTDTALLGLQNMFEQSSISSSPLYLSSWDVKKAFDSLSKNVLRFSWIRLGVPIHVANLLVSLDEDGKTIVRTPYAQQIWSKTKYNGFSDFDYFTALRGAGQGDVSSPFNWNAAYDILLCALSSVSDDQFFLLSPAGYLSPAPDIAYADDLLSGMSSVSGLQRKADIVSAFSLIFGLDIAIPKLRTFVHFPSGPPPSCPPLSIVIHTAGWSPQPIPVRYSGTLKALGKLYDISSPCIHHSQFIHCKTIADSLCNILSRTHGSPHNLSMVARTVIAKRIEYPAQFSAWTQDQHDALDRPFSHLYRKLSANMPTFPTALLYLPHDLGGLGFHKVSDGIQCAKFGIFQRHTRRHDCFRPIDSLLFNAAVASGQSPAPGFSLTIRPPSLLEPTFWANSLLHFAAEGSLFLSRQGFSLLDHPSSTIINVPRTPNPSPLLKWVIEHQAHHLGDLYYTSADLTSHWTDFSATSGALLSSYQSAPPPSAPPILRPHQFWYPSPRSTVPPSYVVELLGWLPNQSDISYRLLPLLHPTRPTNINPVFPPSTPMLGCLSSLSSPPELILGPSPRRVFLSPPAAGSTFRYTSLLSQPSTFSVPSPPTRSSWVPSTFFDQLSLLGSYDIFTDGAWARTGSFWDHVTCNSPTFAGGAGLTFLSSSSSWRDLPVLTMYITQGQDLKSISAFSMELLALLTALHISSLSPSPPTHIYTDCQSAVLKLGKLSSYSSSINVSSADSSMLSSCLSYLSTLPVELCWIKGHPERSEPDESLWTREMWGNHLADRAAAGLLATASIYSYKDNFENHLSIFPIPTMTADSLSALLSPPDHWYFGTSDMQMRTPSIMEAVQLARLLRYLRDRDADRAKRRLPPQWSNYQIPLAARVWNFSRTPASIYFHQRLLWDKHWHQGNQAKSAKTAELRALISQCPLCRSTDSITHWIRGCSYSRSVSIRKDTVKQLRSLISSQAKLHPSNTNITYLGTHFISFVTGALRCSPIWRALWTPSQLDSFRVVEGHRFITDPDLNVLKSLFMQLNRILTSSSQQLWSSRQQAIWELSQYMKVHPDPLYTPPLFVYAPTKPLPPLLPSDLTRMRLEWTTPPEEPIPNSSRTSRTVRPVESLITSIASSLSPLPPTSSSSSSSLSFSSSTSSSSSSPLASGSSQFFPIFHPRRPEGTSAPGEPATASPSGPTKQSKQTRPYQRPRTSIPLHYNSSSKVPPPSPSQPSVAGLRTLKPVPPLHPAASPLPSLASLGSSSPASSSSSSTSSLASASLNSSSLPPSHPPVLPSSPKAPDIDVPTAAGLKLQQALPRNPRVRVSSYPHSSKCLPSLLISDSAPIITPPVPPRDLSQVPPLLSLTPSVEERVEPFESPTLLFDPG